MSYCRNCGAQLSEGAAFCQKCGTKVHAVVKANLAGWGERIIAWIIDMIALGIIISPIKLLVTVAWPSLNWAPDFLPRWIPFVDLGTDNLIYFLYWTFLEGTNGQSIGKMILKIRVTQITGEPVDIPHAAIQSIGKAFLLPIDLLIGWILYPHRKQRLFNYISETIIVRSTDTR